MTQAKLKLTNTEMDKKNVELSKEEKPKCLNDRCVQIAAWILLTLGLCIIVSTFYLAIRQRDAGDILDNDEYESDKGDLFGKNGHDMNVDIVARVIDDKIIKLENAKLKGCETKFCKTICIDAGDIFTVLFDSMERSNCTFLDSLVIYKQKFKRGTLRNDWHYAERTIQEVGLVDSNVTIIRSAAFNSPMFSTTFLLYWRNLNLHNVESGALLGLHALKYLMIDTKISCLDRAFFQPVQTTLVYLKLHAELPFSKDESIFGISHMEKLEYVDLSRNCFNGPITKKTFKGTPNLKYLIMSKNKVTSIAADAFTHLNGKLFLLDLSHNLLKTLGNEVLAPLLEANERTFVNFAMNSWTCNCDIGPLASAYREHRSQFMDALYCKAPHSLYGKFIDEVDFESQNCERKSTTAEKVKSDEVEWPTTLPPFRNETLGDYSDNTDMSRSTETESPNMHLRCWSMYDSESKSADESSGSRSIERFSSSVVSMQSGTRKPMNLFDVDEDISNSEVKGAAAFVDIFDFKKPDFQFELHLYENNSVKITVIDYYGRCLGISFIYFGEKNNDASTRGDTSCLRYCDPFIVTEALSINETYTFCILYMDSAPISPFNCLPLHVPAEREIEEEIWIPRDQKPFTIGMLCLIFLISTFTGAIIAYFAIKAYPDLLEGSKNVLVVKKSDKTCYISTISDTECKRKPSFKKKSSNSSMHKSIVSTPSLTTISQGSTNASDLTRLSSVKSSSTHFEEAFPPVFYVDDEYEMPKPMEKSQLPYDRCIPNTYVATSPRRSPPPLPKRNSKSFSENTY